MTIEDWRRFRKIFRIFLLHYLPSFRLPSHREVLVLGSEG